MKEQNIITEKELLILQNLEVILTKYNISNEDYIIGKPDSKDTAIKFCLTKVSEDSWNTYIKLHDSVFDSVFHSNLTSAIVKLIQYLVSDEEQYILVLQEFLNLLKFELSKKETKKIKYYRKKR